MTCKIYHFIRSLMLMLCTFVITFTTYYCESIVIFIIPVIDHETPVLFHFCITNPSNTGADLS